MGKMTDATDGYRLLEGLKSLADYLAERLDACADDKLAPQLARQYRETMLRIDAIEGGNDGGDEVAAIIIRNRKPEAD